jgi:hypothetical protein
MLQYFQHSIFARTAPSFSTLQSGGFGSYSWWKPRDRARFPYVYETEQGFPERSVGGLLGSKLRMILQTIVEEITNVMDSNDLLQARTRPTLSDELKTGFVERSPRTVQITLNMRLAYRSFGR